MNRSPALAILAFAVVALSAIAVVIQLSRPADQCGADADCPKGQYCAAPKNCENGNCFDASLARQCFLPCSSGNDCPAERPYCGWIDARFDSSGGSAMGCLKQKPAPA